MNAFSASWTGPVCFPARISHGIFLDHIERDQQTKLLLTRIRNHIAGHVVVVEMFRMNGDKQ